MACAISSVVERSIAARRVSGSNPELRCNFFLLWVYADVAFARRRPTSYSGFLLLLGGCCSLRFSSTLHSPPNPDRCLPIPRPGLTVGHVVVERFQQEPALAGIGCTPPHSPWHAAASMPLSPWCSGAVAEQPANWADLDFSIFLRWPSYDYQHGMLVGRKVRLESDC